MKALVVVAHPDDHILWAGGTISRLKEWEWYVFSLCNPRNDNFQPKLTTFENSCKKLGIKRFAAKQLRDYQKKELMEIKQIFKMQKEILAFADKDYDLVFTHSVNSNCEYGFHANHAETRDAINKLLEENLLKTKALLNFCYKALGGGQPVVADLENADYIINLNNQEINKKNKIKRLFKWAEGDLKGPDGLCIWDNDEPKIESFNLKKFSKIELPQDFIKLH